MRNATSTVSAFPTDLSFTDETTSPSALGSVARSAASLGPSGASEILVCSQFDEDDGRRNVTLRSLPVLEKRDELPPEGRDHVVIWPIGPGDMDEINTILDRIEGSNKLEEF